MPRRYPSRITCGAPPNIPARSAMFLTFPPAENALPAPVRMTTRVSTSTFASSTSSTSRSMTSFPEMGLRASGRLIVQVTTWSRRLESTTSAEVAVIKHPSKQRLLTIHFVRLLPACQQNLSECSVIAESLVSRTAYQVSARQAAARRSRFSTFPAAETGSASRNSTVRGTLYPAMSLARVRAVRRRRYVRPHGARRRNGRVHPTACPAHRSPSTLRLRDGQRVRSPPRSSRRSHRR